MVLSYLQNIFNFFWEEISRWEGQKWDDVPNTSLLSVIDRRPLTSSSPQRSSKHRSFGKRKSQGPCKQAELRFLRVTTSHEGCVNKLDSKSSNRGQEKENPGDCVIAFFLFSSSILCSFFSCYPSLPSLPFSSLASLLPFSPFTFPPLRLLFLPSCPQSDYKHLNYSFEFLVSNYPKSNSTFLTFFRERRARSSCRERTTFEAMMCRSGQQVCREGGTQLTARRNAKSTRNATHKLRALHNRINYRILRTVTRDFFLEVTWN